MKKVGRRATHDNYSVSSGLNILGARVICASLMHGED